MTWTPRPVDVAVAAAVAGVCLLGTAAAAGPADAPWWPGGAALILVGAVALSWRSRAPLVVLAVTISVVGPYYWLAFPDGPASLLVVVAVYTVACRLTPMRSVGVGLGVLALWIAVEQVFLVQYGEISDPDRYAWLVAVVAVGVAVGAARRAQTAALARAAEESERRVERERLRIAREVHDVVSHSLASIAVQAGVGVHVADRRPEQAVAALREIQHASRDALHELRAVLGVLRDGDGDAGDTDGPARAAATRGLARLDETVRVASLAGISVVTTGDAGSLAPAVEEAAFRIIREALTNTVRHAPRARTVLVELGHSAGELQVRITDDGGPPPSVDATAGGHGLQGAREHAAAVGGRASTERGSHGFVVLATLPVGHTAIGTPDAAPERDTAAVPR